MMGSEWLYGAIALLVGLHVLTMLYAYRRRSELSTAGAQPEVRQSHGTSPDDTDEFVHCQHCGARNQPGYQFCKQCVADLASGSPPQQQSTRRQAY